MAFHGSYTATLSPTTNNPEAGFPTPRHNALSSSVSSLGRSNSARNGSHISKTYRQASSLFLTRRLPEALSTVLPLITHPTPESYDTPAIEPAPVARASRNTRIKVWSLYLTILNAIAELDPNEGKAGFGAQEWRALTAKIRDGEIWDEVVQNGYHGAEGDVDADVVINLATLLLAHAPNQSLNQKRLENYLSACVSPSFDITKRIQVNQSPRIAPRYSSPARGASGTDTPRDLNARIKILELFTLHVLIRNDEWEYAREFISSSSILDEERREAFLQALESLQEEQQAEVLRLAEQERAEREKKEEAERQSRLQEEREQKAKNAAQKQAQEQARVNGSSHQGIVRQPSANGSSSTSKKLKRNGSKASRGSNGSGSKSPKGKKSKGVAPPPSLASRVAVMLSGITSVVENMGSSIRSNPMVMLRTLGFILGILLIFGRKDMRERLARMFGRSWNKVLATAGMGVKVSYI